MTANVEKKVSLQDMFSISKEISTSIQYYRHCNYQSSIAATIVSYDTPFIIVVSPTGSGKTWIQGLVAKYYCQ
jgi:superfamily II DNA or RNA helicase